MGADGPTAACLSRNSQVPRRTARKGKQMNQDIKGLYAFLLQQLAAEAYLEELGSKSKDDIRRALLSGNNRIDQDTRIGGFTRFTGVQADEFLASYRVVDQLSDNPADGQPKTFNGIPLNTGFSATLLQDTTTGDYPLAI